MIEKGFKNVTPKMRAGSHILYIFNQVDKYIDNAVDFILDGVLNNEVILFVDTKESFENVFKKIRMMGYNSIQLERLIFVDSTETYIIDNQFNLKKTGDLIGLLNPYFEMGCTIRTWGQVLLTDHISTLERLRIFESNSDEFILKSNLISVCAYNGQTTSAYIQNELMRTHTHFMTDSEYIPSPLYDRNYLQIPSKEEIEKQKSIEKQYRNLKSINKRLAQENELISIKNMAITESEQKLRMVFEQLPNPIIIRRDSRILLINDIAKKQLLINSNNISKKHHLHKFFEKYKEYSYLTEKDTVHNHNFTLNNGEEKHYIIKSVELLFEGEPSILHSFLDISQEKENEKIIVRSEKMRVAGELAASIAHEIRNPLTAIKGFFQLMNREQENGMYYSVIDDEITRIEQITSELLTLAKPHTERREIHNIVHLIEGVIILLTSQANFYNIQIINQVKSKELYINCDETKIKQVFINLIKNAIDSMESGGKIILKIYEIDDNIQVKVIDQGNGIPKELMNKIGEPFYTTKEKGTGIGLMVCFQIIESHEGTIKVESNYGSGTTFTVTIPSSIR
ncbi:ATP-binding protein [Niallia taxi]|uniref:ATP-binding protein n=1 Tax=Niallia taxi TaxID=2499688 RepID=UPI003D2C5A8F